MASTGADEDPFADFLSQDASVAGGCPAAAASEPHATGGGDGVEAAVQLKLLVESSQRQEQLLGKVCSLLVGLDGRMGTLASKQDRFESTLQQVFSQSTTVLSTAGRDVVRTTSMGTNRGSLVAPPGKGPINPLASPPPSAPQPPTNTGPSPEQLAQERMRMEEDARLRAEEMQRKRVEDDRRRREEAERQRVEEERRREEERVRKEELEKKTNAALSGLFGSGGASSSLFGDEDTSKKKKSGLFDD
eukprot:TRINITY_DN22973_c0_g1_i1.p1 TRINITY_DN22973_c0_g1~~TRINITY_DN22973_c0_g1_i1.p1  ORF type:complete len:247 (+),score=55.41 TRINITY_DN22973_c0_g1_i1:128-868(+)